MMKLDWLDEQRARMERTRDAAERDADLLQAALAEVEARPGLDADYRRELVDELRKTAQDSLSALVRDSEAMVEAARGEAQHWANVELVLSRAKFADSAADDTTIKAQKLAEFGAMSPATLQAVADAALASGDYATLWLAFNAGRAHHGQPGWRGVDVTKLAIPERSRALRALADIENLHRLTQYQFLVATRGTPTPVARLTADTRRPHSPAAGPLKRRRIDHGTRRYSIYPRTPRGAGTRACAGATLESGVGVRRDDRRAARV